MQEAGPIDCDVHPTVPNLRHCCPTSTTFGARRWSAAGSMS